MPSAPTLQRVPRALLLCAALLVLPGCPEERPGATKEIPPQRLPPAMSLEPQAPQAPAGTGAPGTTARKPEAPPPTPNRP